MRVLWLSKGLGAGGAETLLLLTARAIDRSRVDVEVDYIVPVKDRLVPAFEALGVPVRCLTRTRDVGPLWIMRLWRLVRSGRFDLIHSHSPLLAAVVRLSAATTPSRRRPRTVSTEHNRWPRYRRATRFADRATIRWDDAVLAVSSGVRETIPPRARDRVGVLHHGIDTDAVRAHAGERDRVRLELGVAQVDVAVGVVANLRPAKDLGTMIAAAERAALADVRVRFFVVGQGPLAEELERQRTSTSLGERFRFLGYRDDVHRLVHGFDLLAFSSLHEGLPVAAMEACAAGLPIVSTDVGGMREIVEHGVNGLVVPPSRPDLLAEAILRVAQDEDLRSAMGRASTRAADRFDVRTSTAVIERLYDALLPATVEAARPPNRTRRVLKSALALGSARPVGSGTTVLIYHRVGGATSDERDLRFADLRRQIDELARHRLVALDTALDELGSGDDSPKVVLTFDDGFADVHGVAWPLLRHHGVPFTLYLSTAYVGGEMHWDGSTASAPGPALTWSQLEELAADPLVTIANHTHSHARPERLTVEEVDTCSRLIEERLGVVPRHFAFTWGVPVESALPMLRERFRSSATGLLGRNHPDTDRHLLRRVPVRGSDPLPFFRAKLAGGLGPERAYARLVALAKRGGATG